MAVKLLDDWWRAAACRNADPELFFPISETAVSRSDVRRAKQICAACPVSSPCLRYALAHRQDQGIWGGLTDDERRPLGRLARHREQDAAAYR